MSLSPHASSHQHPQDLEKRLHVSDPQPAINSSTVSFLFEELIGNACQQHLQTVTLVLLPDIGTHITFEGMWQNMDTLSETGGRGFAQQ